MTTRTQGRPALPLPPGVTRVRLDCRAVAVTYGGETKRWLWRDLKHLTFAVLRDMYLAQGYVIVTTMRTKTKRVHTLVMEKVDLCEVGELEMAA